MIEIEAIKVKASKLYSIGWQKMIKLIKETHGHYYKKLEKEEESKTALLLKVKSLYKWLKNSYLQLELSANPNYKVLDLSLRSNCPSSCRKLSYEARVMAYSLHRTFWPSNNKVIFQVKVDLKIDVVSLRCLYRISWLQLIWLLALKSLKYDFYNSKYNPITKIGFAQTITNFSLYANF